MIYIASPYTDNDERVMKARYEAVAKFCFEATQAGYHIFSPIAHWHPIAVKYRLPRDSYFWLRYNLDAMKMSEAFWLLMIDGWSESIDLNRDYGVALGLGLEVRRISPHKFEDKNN